MTSSYPGESGQVFAWGCNAHGALGLGTPPTGPSHAAQPQCLPHIKSATFLVANPCGSVSLCFLVYRAVNLELEPFKSGISNQGSLMNRKCMENIVNVKLAAFVAENGVADYQFVS